MQNFEGALEMCVLSSQAWEKGLGDEGDLQKWDAPVAPARSLAQMPLPNKPHSC
jgi:hypothetical protein